MALGSIQPDTIDELDEGPAPARACSRERAVRIHRDRPSPPEAEWYRLYYSTGKPRVLVRRVLNGYSLGRHRPAAAAPLGLRAMQEPLVGVHARLPCRCGTLATQHGAVVGRSEPIRRADFRFLPNRDHLPRLHQHLSGRRLAVLLRGVQGAQARQPGLVGGPCPPVLSGHTPPNKANVRNLCPCRICTGTGLDRPTSVPGLGSPLPHLHRDWARPCHICTGTGLAPATSAPPTFSRSGLTPAASAPALGLRRAARSGAVWGVSAHSVSRIGSCSSMLPTKAARLQCIDTAHGVGWGPPRGCVRAREENGGGG